MMTNHQMTRNDEVWDKNGYVKAEVSKQVQGIVNRFAQELLDILPAGHTTNFREQSAFMYLVENSITTSILMTDAIRTMDETLLVGTDAYNEFYNRPEGS